MTRLIDADLYKEDMTNEYPEYYEDVLDAQPTVDAEPVRHGKWLWLDGVRCSECNYKIPTIGLPNYCPQCGAYMRESK